jgi:hypothetical protein
VFSALIHFTHICTTINSLFPAPKMTQINSTQLNSTLELAKQIRPYEFGFSIYLYCMCSVNCIFFALSLKRIWCFKCGDNYEFRPISIHGATSIWLVTTFTTLLQPIDLSPIRGFYTIGVAKVCFCLTQILYNKNLTFFS